MRTLFVASCLLASGVAAAQSVTVAGECPGRLSIDVSDITPRGGYVVLKGGDGGSDVIPGGPCAGVRTGLDRLAWFGPFSADAGGNDMLTPTLASPSDDLIQVLDLETCGLSSTAALCRGDVECDPLVEVEHDGRCYYLDGSGGACDRGYELAPQSVLEIIAPEFTGKDYKNAVSDNCCIWHRDQDAELQDWGLSSNCNSPGPFGDGPTFGGAGCLDILNLNPAQLTLCMSS